MKRAWFQLHLSTLLILTLVSGILLWANLRGFNDVVGGYDLVNCGFPYPMKEFQFYIVDCMFDPKESLPDSSIYLWKNVAINAAVGFGVLLAVAVACEWWVRRKRIAGPEHQ